jgi:ribosome-binding factor A
MGRPDRVAEAIKKEVSSIIHDEFKDPRLGFVTITSVEITPDLRYAKIFYSVLGKEEDHQKTRQALESGLGFIRRLLVQRIQLRFAPEISFREDRSSEYSVKIQEVLNEIERLREPRPTLEPAPAVEKEKRRRRKGRVLSGKKAGVKLRKGERREPRKISRKRKKK